jgi:hypothetical protein
MKKMHLLWFCFAALTAKAQLQSDLIRTYGSFSGQWVRVLQDPQNELLMAGMRYQGSNAQQMAFFKVDLQGDTIWSMNYGGVNNDASVDLIASNDGKYAILGNTQQFQNTNITLTKLQPSGQVIWTKTYSASVSQNAVGVVQNNAGEYYIGGKTTNQGQLLDFFIVKTNATGDTLWTRCFGGTQDDVLYDIILCNDGSVVLAGYSNSFGSTSELYFIKVNSSGNMVWSKHYGGPNAKRAYSLKETFDGGFILSGEVKTGIVSSAIYLVRTNSTGDTLWTRSISQTDTEINALDIIQTIDGGFALTGCVYHWEFVPPNVYSLHDSYALLAKFDAAGALTGFKEFVPTPAQSGLETALGASIIQLSDGRFAIAGSYFNGSTFELLLILTNSYTNVGLSEFAQQELLIFPNPARDHFKITSDQALNACKLNLYKTDGTLLRSRDYNVLETLCVEREGLPADTYLYKLYQNERVLLSGKIIFE